MVFEWQIGVFEEFKVDNVENSKINLNVILVIIWFPLKIKYYD